MVSTKAIQALVLALFMIIVFIGLFFLLNSQLAPLWEEMEGNRPASNATLSTTFTPAPLIPATLTAMNQVLAATVEPRVEATTPAPTSALPAATTRTGIVNSDMINVRSYPDLAGDIVAQAREGERLEILATSTDGKWLQVCCPLGTTEGNRQSWVAAEFVTIAQGANAAVITQSNTLSTTIVELVGTPAAPTRNADGVVTGTVNSSGVNLRSGPGTMYGIVGQAQEQTSVELTGRDITSLWWRICCPPGAPTESWISAEFVNVLISKEQALTLVPVVTTAATPVATLTAP